MTPASRLRFTKPTPEEIPVFTDHFTEGPGVSVPHKQGAIACRLQGTGEAWHKGPLGSEPLGYTGSAPSRTESMSTWYGEPEASYSHSDVLAF